MAQITLKQLRYFDALAREQHFGRAAETCAVTQPALSMQIAELEEQLGLALVERTRGGVRLTERGAEIALRAARILGEVRNLIEHAAASGALLTGSLRLGVIPSIAPYLLPPLLPLLRASYPDLALFVRETQTKGLIDELVAGKLDVLLLALPVRHPDLETLALFEDRFFLALPATHAFNKRLRATPELVVGERLLLLEEGHCLRDQALDYCSLKQVDTVNTFGASSLSTLVELVAAGYGITLLPDMCVAIESRGRAISIVRFAEPEPARTIGLAWRASSPRAKEFAEIGRLATAARGAGKKPGGAGD